MPSEREQLEAAFGLLIGKAFRLITYLGAWKESPSEPGAYVEWVELTTIGTRPFRVTTEPDFGDHGLALYEEAVDRSDALKIYDATRLPVWSRVLGTRAVGAKLLWRPLRYAPAAMPGEAPEWPRDLVLTFENGHIVVLSAASIGQDGAPVLGVDSVGAFTAEEARSLAILGP
jgi:hypothetical protein